MATERYERPQIGKWIVPAMFGPWLSMSTAASLYAAFGPEHRFVGPWAVWAIGMIAGTLLATVFTLIQVLVDVVLLAIRQRRLPTGKAAWIMSFGAPFAVVGSYALMSPVDLYKYGPWAIVAAILAPMIVAAFAVRVVVGPRIDPSLRVS
jgi:hypothetical protein